MLTPDLICCRRRPPAKTGERLLFKLQSNFSTTVILGTEESDRFRKVVVIGRGRRGRRERLERRGRRERRERRGRRGRRMKRGEEGRGRDMATGYSFFFFSGMQHFSSL